MIPQKFGMRVLLIGLFALTSVSLLAQAEVTYRLRVPDAEEYLKAVPEIVGAWQEEIPVAYAKVTQNPLVLAVLLELNDDSELFLQDFDVLMPAYLALSSAVGSRNPTHKWPEWGEALLRIWLRDNPTNLAHVDTLDIPGFQIVVHQNDFNGDGIDEFWLDVDFDVYSNYIVLARDPSDATGYRFIETPLTWLGRGVDYASNAPTESEIVYLGDMTGDAIPEWLIFRYPVWDCGPFYVLSWQDGKLINLTSESIGFCPPGDFLIDNIDDDTDLEIIYSHPSNDIWYCEETSIDRLGWNGTSFVPLPEPLHAIDSLGCALRQAEPLMWENRVGEAIPLYEAGLAIGWGDKSVDYASEYEFYAYLRLALAYALDGQISQAQSILAELEGQTSTSEALNSMSAAMQATHSSLDMCVAAYNLWVEYAVARMFNELPIHIEVGALNNPSRGIGYYPIEPEKAGCNAPQLIDELLEKHTFKTDEDPPEQLLDMGISVLDTFSADFDRDGTHEWLVWMEGRVNPVFFVSDGEHYVISRPAVRRPDNYTEFGIQSLPDQQNQALIEYVYLDFSLTYIESVMYEINPLNCGNDVSFRGQVRLWRLQDTQLEPIVNAPLCEARSIFELFSADGQQFYAGAIVVQENPSLSNIYGDVVYTWDAAQQTYVSQPPLQATTVSDLQPLELEQQLTDAYLFDKLFEAYYDLRDGEGKTALQVLDDARLRADSSASPVIIYGLDYYRALALEALNRPDEALAEYISIYEAAPDSAWGMLAELHLEVVGH